MSVRARTHKLHQLAFTANSHPGLNLQDKLMTVTPESEGSSGDNVHWIFKNKDHGKTSATASLVRLGPF